MKKKGNLVAGIIGFSLFLAMFLLLIFDGTKVLDQFGIGIKQYLDYQVVNTLLLFVTNIMSVLGVVVIVVGSIFFLRKRHAKRDLCIFLVTVLTSLGTSTLIKFVLKRTRPADLLLDIGGYSFPSNHSVAGTVIYGFIILLILKYHKKNKRRAFMIFICLMLIFLTGFSRIYFNVHYITDVIGGIGFGIMSLAFANRYIIKSNG